MESTNIKSPTGHSVVKATVAPLSGHAPTSTCGVLVNGNRTVTVKTMQGSVRLRYSPVPPKVSPTQSR